VDIFSFVNLFFLFLNSGSYGQDNSVIKISGKQFELNGMPFEFTGKRYLKQIR